MDRRKLVLLILDGWGYSDIKEHNAVYLSNPLNFNKLMDENPNVLMAASGEAVGLPEGQMGNSEVGHTNIGAGRVVYQDLLKINKAVESGEISENKTINRFFENTANTSGRLHFFGLLSDGGVHSHINHLKSLINSAKLANVKEVYIHTFMDGRDTPPSSGASYMENLESHLKEINYGSVATVSGRYYAMDRDNRWDRVGKAFDVIRNGKGDVAESGCLAVTNAYKNDVTDEFVPPTVVNKDGMVKDNDSIFFFNFRADRAREITRTFIDKDFSEFDRGSIPDVNYMSMTEYDNSFGFDVAFPSDSLSDIFGEVISEKGMKQLRIAETEKYAHVTFFFNGGREEAFENEERCLVESPRDVATYDEKPEMSVVEVTDKFCNIFERGDTDVVIMNFANSDMIGHTGVEKAAIEACSVVDKCLARVVESVNKMDAVLLVTADHGNSEEMWDATNKQPQTAHTTNPVPFIVHNYNCSLVDKGAKLADIAPTMLDILGIAIPKKMTGVSLIAK